jgi:hypothetical protein
VALEEVEEGVLVGADLDQDDVVVAGLEEAVDRLEVALRRRPAAYPLATVSGETCSVAPAKPSVSGSSASTGQPATDQRK